jgi:predicted esterase
MVETLRPLMVYATALTLTSACADVPDTAGDADTDADTAGDADGSGGRRLVVTGGFGGGVYAAGEEAHVWAAVDPRAELLARWDGDAPLLDGPAEWHTTLVMPDHDVALTAVIESRPAALERWDFAGATERPKRVRSFLPDGPRGLVLLLHGTGGSSAFVEQIEPWYLARAAIARGFGVVAFEAEEVAAGDLDGNGKIRWNSRGGADNVDFANVDALVADLEGRDLIGPSTPLFALGMSNGGAFAISLGAVAATEAGAAFPRLVFAAVASYCADGLAEAAAVTSTPTAWLMCGQDTNEEVANDEARAASEALAARGVPTLFDVHPPSPLYAERLARVEGVDVATSIAIVAELRAAGFLDDAGYVIEAPEEIARRVVADPRAFPTLAGLAPARQLDALDQVRVAYADHQMYSDWSSRTLDFFEAHLE